MAKQRPGQLVRFVWSPVCLSVAGILRDGPQRQQHPFIHIHGRGKAATRDPPRRTAGAAVPGLDLSAGSGMLCRANHAAAIGPAREPFAKPLCVPRCSCRSSREAGGGRTATHTGSTGRANWVRQTGIAEWLGAVVPSLRRHGRPLRATCRCNATSRSVPSEHFAAESSY